VQVVQLIVITGRCSMQPYKNSHNKYINLIRKLET